MEGSKQPRDKGKFVFEVAKYFMEFLETNFQRRRIPKRTIQTRNKSNLLVGINTKKYSNFYLSLLKRLEAGLDGNAPIKITKGQYTAGLASTIQNTVEGYSNSIEGSKHSKILNDVTDLIDKAKANNKDDVELAKSTAFSGIQEILVTSYVQPLFEKIGNSLKSLYDFDESYIIELSHELGSVLVSETEACIAYHAFPRRAV